MNSIILWRQLRPWADTMAKQKLVTEDKVLNKRFKRYHGEKPKGFSDLPRPIPA